jgi:hypothetical protein
MRDSLAKLIEGLDITANPYLRALREGTMRRAEFVETQIQFLHAVVFFPRPLMVLASRLPRPEMRLSLLHNVDDEHGHGNLSISHEQTFLKLLQQLGASPDEIEPPSPPSPLRGSGRPSPASGRGWGDMVLFDGSLRSVLGAAVGRTRRNRPSTIARGRAACPSRSTNTLARKGRQGQYS